MRRITFDLDVLRTFVTGIELGSFAKAADRLGRSTSAVSTQIKNLEAQLGTPILRKAGRGLEPTPAGETLLSYARRLLALNDEAVIAIASDNLEGQIRIGLQEDFGESFLTHILGDFSRAHPRVQIEARIARNAELIDLIQSGQLDIALAWDAGQQIENSEMLGTVAMQWIGKAESDINEIPLPLVLFNAPCLMRSAAIAALDNVGRQWRVAFTSPSLNGIWSAVNAGLGITVRTSAALPQHLSIINDLPKLPTINLFLHSASPTPTPAMQRLMDIIKIYLEEYLTV